MMENAKKLLEMLSKDKDLAERFAHMDKTEVFAAAKELGIELNEEDLTKPEGTVSDDELASVTGGSGGCYCQIAGGGGGKENKDDNNTYGCACVIYGQGGDGAADSRDCICISGGYGDGESDDKSF